MKLRFYKVKYLFFWLPWVFVAALELSLFAVSRSYSIAARRLLIAGTSLVSQHGL